VEHHNFINHKLWTHQEQLGWGADRDMSGVKFATGDVIG